MAPDSAHLTLREHFDHLMVGQEITPNFLARRWNKSVRRINQIRVTPTRMYVDALEGYIYSTMEAEEALTRLDQHYESAAETTTFLAARWSLTRRRINQIRSEAKQLHVDALGGVVRALCCDR